MVAPTLSAGLIEVNNLTVTSGTSAALTATQATVTNLTATNVNATNFTLNNADSLTIGGQFYAQSNYAKCTPVASRQTIKTQMINYSCHNWLPSTLPNWGAVSTMDQPTVPNPFGWNQALSQVNYFVSQALTPFNVPACTYNMETYSVYNCESLLSLNIPEGLNESSAFAPLCDELYVYHLGQNYQANWANQLDFSANIAGVNWTNWTYFGSANGWCRDMVIIKQSRDTGKVVQVKYTGYMVNEYYYGPAISGTTNSAVFNIPDGSANYAQTDVQTAEGYGAGTLRALFAMYNDPVVNTGCMYTIGTWGSTGNSLMKIDTADLKLIYRQVIGVWDPIIYPGNPQIYNQGEFPRSMVVAPPTETRPFPMIIVGTTNLMQYTAVTSNNTIRDFDYYTAGGHVFGYTDIGYSCSLTWSYANAPKTFLAGSLLDINVFPLTDSPGVPNASMEIYEPLRDGYVFTDGSANGRLAKTTGTFNLLVDGKSLGGAGSGRIDSTGINFYDASVGTGATQGSFKNYHYHDASGFVLGADSLPILSWRANDYLFGSFDFTKDSSNYKVCSGAFDKTKSYYCTVQNGPTQGQRILVPGTWLVPAVDDLSPTAKFAYDASGNSQGWQPVIKTLYKTMAGNYQLTMYEASELSLVGGGIYMSFVYDPVNDVVSIPSSNLTHSCYEYDKKAYQYLWSHTYDLSGNALSTNTNINLLNNYDSAYPYINPRILANPVWDAQSHYQQNTMMFNPNSNVFADSSNSRHTTHDLIKAWQTRHWTAMQSTRDNLKLGSYYDRMAFDSVTGLNVSDGTTKFLLKLNSYDCADHSVGFDNGGAEDTVFHSDGPNQDISSVTLVESVPYYYYSPAGEIIATQYNLTDPAGNPGKWLVARTKSHPIVFDYNQLLTSTLVGATDASGNVDPSGQFIYGLASNDSMDSKIYEETMGPQQQFMCFGSSMWDGSMFVSKTTGQNFLPEAYLAHQVTNIAYPVPGLVDPNNYVTPPFFASANVYGAYAPTLYSLDLSHMTNIPRATLATMNRDSAILDVSGNPVINKYTGEPRYVCPWIQIGHANGALDAGVIQGYGNMVVMGQNNGKMNMISIQTGAVIQTVFCSEGAQNAPTIVDGIMYGYGGTGKWGGMPYLWGNKAATQLNMWTPNGK